MNCYFQMSLLILLSQLSKFRSDELIILFLQKCILLLVLFSCIFFVGYFVVLLFLCMCEGLQISKHYYTGESIFNKNKTTTKNKTNKTKTNEGNKQKTHKTLTHTQNPNPKKNHTKNPHKPPPPPPCQKKPPPPTTVNKIQSIMTKIQNITKHHKSQLTKFY